MLYYIVKRLSLILPTLFGVITVTFIVVQFVPGGPVEQMIAQIRHGSSGSLVGDGAKAVAISGMTGSNDLGAERIAQIRALYGFDKPIMERFWLMMRSFAVFELGESFYQHKPVWQLIKEKLPVSISLGLWTFIISYMVAIPLGVAKALRNGSRFDIFTTLFVLIGYAIPGFMLGVVLLVIFGGQLQWFPLRGLTSDTWSLLSWPARVLDYLWHITLPVLSMVLGNFAITTILIKNTLIEEIHKQYVFTARSKGLSNKSILWKHVFRNALIPIITGLPAAFVGAFFTGSLLIETLFSLDGLGLLSYESIIRRDYPVVFGSLYLFTLIGLLTKLMSDLCYTLVDPRVRFD